MKNNPNDSYARAHRAFLIYLAGDEKEAMRILDEMLKEAPDDSLAQGVKDAVKAGVRLLDTATKR